MFIIFTFEPFLTQVWSPFPIPRGYNSKEACVGSRRELYSHSDYLSFIQYGGLPLSHDEYESKSTEEDPRMLAFFDSLIQREKDNFHPDSDDSFLDDLHLSFILEPDSSEESDSDHTGTSMSRLLMRELLHRPSPGPTDREVATNSSGQGVLRRLRHLRDAAVIRDLLNADSSSSDDGRDTHFKVVPPELSRDLESGQSTLHSPAQFKRHQSRTNRCYRVQNRSRNDNERSKVLCDSSSSDSDCKYSRQKSKAKTGRNISHLEESSGSSSSIDSEDDSRISKATKKNTESSSDEAKSCKIIKKRKNRQLHRTDVNSPSKSLEVNETVCKATEHKINGFTDSRDNHLANWDCQVKVTKSNEEFVSSTADTKDTAESNEGKHHTAANRSNWTGQSDNVVTINNKSDNTQRKEDEENEPDSNR